MLFRKIIYSLLLIGFLGALALTSLPGLHEREHQSSASADHQERGDCKVCHILGNFVVESVPVQTVVLASQDFIRFKNQAYQAPSIKHVHSALIPRAPPTV